MPFDNISALFGKGRDYLNKLKDDTDKWNQDKVSSMETPVGKDIMGQLTEDPISVGGSTGGVDKMAGLGKEMFQEAMKNAKKLNEKNVIDYLVKKFKPESAIHDFKPAFREAHSEALRNQGLENVQDVIKRAGLNPDIVKEESGLASRGAVIGDDLFVRNNKDLSTGEHELQHVLDKTKDPKIMDLYKRGILNPSQGVGAILDPEAMKTLGITRPEDIQRLSLLKDFANKTPAPGITASELFNAPKNQKFIQNLYNEAPNQAEAFKHFEGNHFVGDNDIIRFLKSLKGE